MKISLSPRRTDIVLRIGLAFGQSMALAWFAPDPLGLPLDDAWIHQVVARTFAESGTLGYTAGLHGAAATSYLWAALLAFNFAVLHISPVKWAFALNATASLVAGQLLYRLLDRVRTDDPWWRFLAFGVTALTCIQGHMLWFAWSGMEVPMLVALSLGVVLAVTSGRPLAAGLCSSLLAVLRPEAAALGGIAFAYTLLRDRKKALLVAGPWALMVLLYVGLNLLKTGHALPTTLSGRRWLWFDPSAGTSHAGLVFAMFDHWKWRLTTFVFADLLAPFFIGSGFALYGAIRLLREKSDGTRLLYLWGIFHTGFYVVMLPTPGHGGRYQPFLPFLFVLSAGIGVVIATADLLRLVRVGPRYALLSLLGIATLSTLGAAAFKAGNACAVRHIETTELGMGNLVAKLPLGKKVGSFDIGGIGWNANRPIFDLGGLSEIATAKRLENGDLTPFIFEKNLDYVVLPDAYDYEVHDIVAFASRLRLEDNAAIFLEPVRAIESPALSFWPGEQATWNAAPKQVLYEVKRLGGAAPRVMPAIRDRIGFRDPRERVLPGERPPIEHSLAVLAQWDAPIELSLDSTGHGNGCRVALGEDGVSVTDCDELLGPAATSYLTERVLPFLDAGDYAGAARESLHAAAAIKRRSDPSFYPLLVPNGIPARGDRRTILERYALGWMTISIPIVFLVMSKRLGHIALALMIGCSSSPDTTHGAAKGELAVDAASRARAPAAQKTGHTALHAAASRGDASAIARLLRAGAVVDADDAGVLPLHLAARRGSPAAIAILARLSRFVDAPAGPRRRTPLADAVLTSNVDGIRALLMAGADPNLADAEGQTPLHLLVAAEPTRALALTPTLLAAGADPLRLDRRGFTALHAAAFADDGPLVALLGPNEAKTPSGETALQLALRYHRDRAAEVLLALGSTSRERPPMHEAALMDDVDRAAALLGSGCDLDRVFSGATALELARTKDSLRVVALLSARRP